MAIGKDKRRVFVTLPDYVHAELKAISDLTGVAVGSFCGQLLMDALPALKGIRDALESAKDDRAASFDKLASVMAYAQDISGKAQLDMLEESIKLRRTPEPKGGNSGG